MLGQGISPALRGWTTGIGSWISWTDAATALLSQLLVVSGVMLCLRLVLATMRERRLSPLQRLVTVPAAAGVLTLSVAASKATLDPVFALCSASGSALVALASSLAALRPRRTRALGLVLLVVGLAALLQAGVRLLALEANRNAVVELYDAARALATVAFVLFVVSLAIVAAWLLPGRHRVLSMGVLVLTACGVAAWLADRGSHYGASGITVLLGRVLTEMARQPSPLVVPVVRHWVELISLVAAAAAVLWPGKDRPVQAALALVALAGVEADIPAFALILTLAALSAGLVSTSERPPTGAAETTAPGVERPTPSPEGADPR